MALQIRRGIDGSGAGGRLTVTPNTGELLYTTDTKKLYIGDGSTAGGTLVTGIGNVVEDLTPQLGGNLDVNGLSIVSVSNGNIVITPNGTGTIQLNGSTNVGNTTTLVDGKLSIFRNNYGSVTNPAFLFAQHHNTPDSVNFLFYRTRGTGLIPTAVLDNDDLADIVFNGWNGTTQTSGASISAVVEGTPIVGNIPTKFTFSTNNGYSTAIRAELSSGGIWKTNNIQNYTGTDLNISGTGTITATNVIIGNGAAIPAAGTILTTLGTVTGSPAIGAIISGGTVEFGTRITGANIAIFTSTVSTTTLTVSVVSSGTVSVGMVLSGGSVTSGTYIVAFVSGINGGAGVYTLNQSATGTPTTGTSFTVSTSQLVRSTTITSGGNVNLVGNVKILGQNSLRFADADSSNYVAFKAPAIAGSNITWTLPSAVGDAGQVLTAAGSGTLQWSVPLASAAPLTTTSAGTVGQIAFDASYIYVCVAAGTWVRAALASW